MLEEYKDLLAAVAGIVTIGQMFSGVFLCLDIYKAGTTKNFPSAPFIGGLVISALFQKHGALLGDDAMGLVNFVGITINILYVLFFYAWSPSEERTTFLKQLATGIAVAAVLLGYAEWEDPEVVATRFGIILTAILFLLVSAPLFSVREIIRKKSADNIPFPMVVTGLLMGVLWGLYGVAAHQPFIVYQNLFMLTLSFPQLVLCLMYPAQRNKQKST